MQFQPIEFLLPLPTLLATAPYAAAGTSEEEVVVGGASIPGSEEEEEPPKDESQEAPAGSWSGP